MVNMSTNTKSGNVLFIILVGIVLFAALTVTVTKAGKNTSGSKREKTALLASELIDYATSVKAATQRLLISKGCANTEISFETSKLTGYAHTPSINKCRLFHSAGGKMNYHAPNLKVLDKAHSSESGYGEWFLTGGLGIPSMGTTGYTADELILTLPYIKDDICKKINEKGQVPTNPIPEEDNTPAAHFILKFTGTYGGGVDIDGNGNSQPIRHQHHFGCTSSSNNTGAGIPANVFFTVLIPR